MLRVADEMGITPCLGIRIKLATEGSGRWAKSGGERSKFGLSAVELMKLLDKLEREPVEDLRIDFEPAPGEGTQVRLRTGDPSSFDARVRAAIARANE